MEPMEAWRVISRNLKELYHLRHQLTGDPVPWTQEDISAEVIAFAALKAMEEEKKNGHSKENRD